MYDRCWSKYWEKKLIYSKTDCGGALQLKHKNFGILQQSEYGYHMEPMRIHIKNQYAQKGVFECALLLFCFVLFSDAMVTICFIFGGCRCVFSILHSTPCSTPFSFLLSEFVSWINF